ncbi:hypothetical protein ACQY0O_003766 [Thecaphora frezii]
MTAAQRPITILYFAGARTLLGTSSETLHLPTDTTTLPLSSLPDLLAERHPQQADELRKLLSGSKWSVDQSLIDEDEVASIELKGGEEVAVIPPGEGHAGPSSNLVKPIAREDRIKPTPTVSGLRAFSSSHPSGASPLLPTAFSYFPAPSSTESNLLILFHGLGDTQRPFATLGQSLQRTLPQTAVLSVQASKRVPFLDEGEEAWMWWDTFDSLGEILTKPNPTSTVAGIQALLDYLTAPREDSGCAWPPFALHLFGFGQGGSVALESAVAFAKKRRQIAAHSGGAAPPTDPKTVELGSVVSICASLVSHPTLDPLLSTPILYVHRTPAASATTVASLRKATRALQIEKFDPIGAPGGEVVTEAMPRNQREWDPVMRFWSRLLRNRTKWEVEGELHTIA